MTKLILLSVPYRLAPMVVIILP